MKADLPAPRKEKRRHPRFQHSIPAELTGTQSFPYRGETTDISMCGFYFTSVSALPPGSVVGIKLSLPNGKWMAKGIVRTCDPGVGNGIEFTQMDRSSKEQLQQFLKLSVQTSPR